MGLHLGLAGKPLRVPIVLLFLLDLVRCRHDGGGDRGGRWWRWNGGGLEHGSGLCLCLVPCKRNAREVAMVACNQHGEKGFVEGKLFGDVGERDVVEGRAFAGREVRVRGF